MYPLNVALTFKNKHVDRVWLGVIALALLMWLAIMVERLGARYVFGFIALAFVARYFSSRPARD